MHINLDRSILFSRSISIVKRTAYTVFTCTLRHRNVQFLDNISYTIAYDCIVQTQFCSMYGSMYENISGKNAGSQKYLVKRKTSFHRVLIDGNIGDVLKNMLNIRSGKFTS